MNLQRKRIDISQQSQLGSSSNVSNFSIEILLYIKLFVN